ncbi:MAG: hypothetical protein QM668_21200 [Agriterribacter sp.]
MKNRKFSKLSFDDAQILSREELKHVLGGDGYGGGGYGGGVLPMCRCSCSGGGSIFYCYCFSPFGCIAIHCSGAGGACAV